MERKLSVELTAQQWATILECLDIVEERECVYGIVSDRFQPIVEAIDTDEYNAALMEYERDLYLKD
jgi:hypothetical protein